MNIQNNFWLEQIWLYPGFEEDAKTYFTNLKKVISKQVEVIMLYWLDWHRVVEIEGIWWQSFQYIFEAPLVWDLIKS